jgi:NifU-like protein involved in Fe-S cluster formation
VTEAPRGAALYTPDLLGMAVSLADYPLDPALPHTGIARSRTCGGTVTLACSTDAVGAIAAVGVRAAACAVGQAAAAIFAQGAAGRDRADIAKARDELLGWLAGERAAPDWPGLDQLDAARAYPARHGAIPLAWEAALAALSNAGEGG